MYQLLLTKRYLFSKIMPLLAAMAVVLCTAMVLVVWSVMNGFLTMLIGSGRTMTGDVAIVWPNAGFGHYQELVSELEKDPQVAAVLLAPATVGDYPAHPGSDHAPVTRSAVTGSEGATS